jgi:hypothetical protein
LSYQTATVYFDGTLAGTWIEPWNNPDYRWLDDVFEIPGELTKGKRAISIRLVPETGLTGTSVWTASHYEASALTVPFANTQNPGLVTGLTATGGQYNPINLSWEPDTDSVGVIGYKVYGSMDSSVPLDSSTYLSQTPVPGFPATTPPA